MVRNGFISVHMDVDGEPYIKPQSKPDPAATDHPPQPRVVPKQSPPKPQPPRIMTIKEVEDQYSDRPHWMV